MIDLLADVPPNFALGLLETTGFTPAMVAVDVMEKSSDVQVVQCELNDMLGVCIKILGPIAAVETAIRQGLLAAERLQGKPIGKVINRPDAGAWRVIEAMEEVSPLIQQQVVIKPVPHIFVASDKSMADPIPALGFIETQGFTAVFEAIDTACKSANVEVVGKEKLGGGYVTVIVKGDVAAVSAAIESGRQRVEGLGKLIAAHVIPRPSSSVLSLLPKS